MLLLLQLVTTVAFCTGCTVVRLQAKMATHVNTRWADKNWWRNEGVKTGIYIYLYMSIQYGSKNRSCKGGADRKKGDKWPETADQKTGCWSAALTARQWWIQTTAVKLSKRHEGACGDGNDRRDLLYLNPPGNGNCRSHIMSLAHACKCQVDTRWMDGDHGGAVTAQLVLQVNW